MRKLGTALNSYQNICSDWNPCKNLIPSELKALKRLSKNRNNCHSGPFGSLGIGILASALALMSALVSALQNNYFVLQSSFFCLSKFYIKKASMVEYFSSKLADIPGSFRRCLEQLFCRKPANACFWKMEFHCRRYLKSFKNTQAAFCRFLNFW